MTPAEALSAFKDIIVTVAAAKDAMSVVKDIIVSLAAIVAACVGIFGLGSWRRQTRHNNREKHYTELLSSLTKIQVASMDLEDYFQEPGSEHRSYSDDEQFQDLLTECSGAMHSIRRRIGPVEVFLSPTTVAVVRTLVVERYHLSESSVCDADYVRSTLKLVNEAHAAVLQEAKRELAG